MENWLVIESLYLNSDQLCAYRKSSIRSRPCIISNPKFPRLVLEVFQKLQFLEQNFLSEAAHKGPNRVILKDLNFYQ